MKPLASLVSTSRTLTELNLSRVMIGAEGAKALCVGLRDPACALKVLELGACKLRADGAKHLGDAIRANASILRLGLSRNSLGDKGVFELVAGGLESAKSLVELDVRDNAIGPEGAKRLTTALRTKNFTLRALAFSGNKLADVKTAALVALAMSTTRGVRLKPQVVAAGNAEEKSANPVTSKEAEGDENKLPETAATAAAAKPPSPARQIATSSEEDFIEEDLPEEIDD
jgi:Ran GTPase-activating protein (RanGAP) involved in mRNA processing and transport